MKNIIICLFLVANLPVFSQHSTDTVLNAIERNNTTLSALRKKTEAEKTGNKTGLFLADPEVELNYLPGNPSAIGNRTDISIRQSFDFPTAYLYRKQISALKNEQAEMEYQNQRRGILQKARILCVELTYNNTRRAEYFRRKEHARQIAEAYEKKFNAGETGILEFNKSRVYLLNRLKDLENTNIERVALLSELTGLNGGTPIAFNDSTFATQMFLPGFEQWYAVAEQNNPMLNWVNHELSVTQKQEQLQMAKNLPGFSAGYMSEKIPGEQFQGVTLGISIPLWENKNTMKYANALSSAAQGLQSDLKTRFYHEMKTLHAKAMALSNSVETYRNELAQLSNTELLTKALDKGEISLGEYFFELSLYYDSSDKLLEMEHELNLAIAELSRYQ